MAISFISVYAPSNNPAKAKLIHLAILKMDGEEVLSEFQSFIKAVPRLSPSERNLLTMDYSEIQHAPPLCDLATEIISLIENTQTVFLDKFSEIVFKKTFKDIGYPVGGATFFLDRIFKKTFKPGIPFELKMCLEMLDLEPSIENNMEKCRGMVSIFQKLESLNSINSCFFENEVRKKKDFGINFDFIPKIPGVYFFRDEMGKVIYVGKAKNISKRVRSHFSSSLKFERELCLKTNSVDFEETGSETIALLLEAHYINQLKPAENTLQKDIPDPHIITSKMDSKGIHRIQVVQKSFEDSENEFYYNRISVIQKLMEIQQKFNLCKRFTGIERTSSRCSDTVFCKGVCQGLEDVSVYNSRVEEALNYVFSQRPSYIIRLKGRNSFEQGLVLIKNGIYHGFGFIDADSSVNSLEDIEGFVKPFSHNYFTSRILDQYFKNSKNASQNLLYISDQ